MIWEPPAVLLCFTREIGVQSLPASDMNYSEGATELIRQFNDHRFTISGPKVGRREKKLPSSRGRHNDYPDAWTDLRFDSRGHGQSENWVIIMLLYFDYCCLG